MKRFLSQIAAALAALTVGYLPLPAADITGVKLFSETDYARVAIETDAAVKTEVETNAAENLIFIRFEGTGIALDKQSYLFDGNPHVEAVTFLPLSGKTVVARIKARHPFRLKTYETTSPPRVILELRAAETSAPATQGNTPPALDYYRRGLDQMQKGTYDAALMSLRSAIRAGQRVPESYYQAGRIRLRQGEKDKALINFSRAARSSDFGDAAALYMSWLHLQNGNADGLRNSWRQLADRLPGEDARLRLASSCPEVDYRKLSQAVSGVERPAEVQVAADKPQAESAEASGQDADSYLRQGLIAKDKGEFAQAVTLLEKAVAMDGSDSEAHFQLGVVYKALGRSRLSAHEFELSLGGGVDKTPAQEVEGVPATREEAELLNPGTIENNEKSTSAAPAASESEPIETATATAQTIAVTGSAGSAGQSEPAAKNGGILGVIRSVSGRMVDGANLQLLRSQVKMLTVIMGAIFLLTLATGWFARRKSGKAESSFGLLVPSRQSVGGNGGGGQVRNVSPVSVIENKRQVARVLARELATKRQAELASAEAGETSQTLALELKPVGERGMYGADIARRIKEQLSRGGGEAEVYAGTVSRKGADDMQVRLIRQLRSKNWTIGDIAQEMNLSREEIKWALSGAASREDKAAAQEATDSASYGQARNLMAMKKKRNAPIDPRSIDREVDLELEINV